MGGGGERDCRKMITYTELSKDFQCFLMKVVD